MLSRRDVIKSLAVGGLGGLAVGGAQIPEALGNDSRDDLGKLRSILKELQVASGRLDGILANFEAPPNPIKPLFHEVLDEIQLYAMCTFETADEISRLVNDR